MKGWLKSPADPKEMFPIEHLPKETWGEDHSDAVGLLYRKKSKQKSQPGVHIDKEKEEFFRRVLPILDGFDNIFRFAQNSNLEENETLANWMRTLETLFRRLQNALEKEGLIAIQSAGKPLDLSEHEVVDVRETTEALNNTIVDEVVKGYRFGRRILRDAKVIVARNPKKEGDFSK